MTVPPRNRRFGEPIARRRDLLSIGTGKLTFIISALIRHARRINKAVAVRFATVSAQGYSIISPALRLYLALTMTGSWFTSLAHLATTISTRGQSPPKRALLSLRGSHRDSLCVAASPAADSIPMAAP